MDGPCEYVWLAVREFAQLFRESAVASGSLQACGHIYHPVCFVDAVTDGPCRCPLCRRSLEEVLQPISSVRPPLAVLHCPARSSDAEARSSAAVIVFQDFSTIFMAACSANEVVDLLSDSLMQEDPNHANEEYCWSYQNFCILVIFFLANFKSIAPVFESDEACLYIGCRMWW